jgi:hypothetical protein
MLRAFIRLKTQQVQLRLGYYKSGHQPTFLVLKYPIIPVNDRPHRYPYITRDS